MSAEATGWVWKFSPYRGAELLVHLAIADVVNDAHGHEFWMSTAKLADKARVSRATVSTTLSDMCARRLLTMVESGAATRTPSVYRFEMTSPTTALDKPNHRASASPTTGLGMPNGKTSTSPISPESLAQPPRAIPKEITQEPKGFASRSQTDNDRPPDADCIRCRGKGELYGTEHPRRCSCTYIVDPALALVEGIGR